MPLLKDLAAECVGGAPKYRLSFLSFSTIEDDVTEEYRAIASSTGGEFNTYDFTSQDNVDLFQSFMDKNVSGFLDLSGYTDSQCLLLDVMACAVKHNVPVVGYCGWAGQLGLMDHHGNTGTYCSQITDDKVSGDIRLDKLLPLLGVFNRKAPPKNLPPVNPIPPCQREVLVNLRLGRLMK